MEAVERFKLGHGEAVLVIVDVQERLAAAVEHRARVIRNIEHLGVLCRDLDIPIIVTEQYPRGLGSTVPELREEFAQAAVEKIAFSCCGEPNFLSVLDPLGRKKIVLVGMETHVCVLQTALDLLSRGFHVHVVADAVTSRTAENRDRALSMLQAAGAVVTVTETVLFQLLEKAGTETFKKISKRIK